MYNRNNKYMNRSDIMVKTAIVTDSTSDLSEELLKKYDIKLLPLRVIYSNGEYKDRIDITPEEIYARFNEEIPSTSLPSPQEALELFEKLKEEGYTHVIVVAISSGISGTMNMIKSVVDSVEGLIIEVIDSKSLTMGLGFPVIEGARELQKTGNFDSAVKKIREAIAKTKVFYVVKTLDYLRKGGRIGKVEGTIGEFLDLKPIISINEEGIYYSYKKVRGRNKSIEKLYEIVKDYVSEKRANIAVAHGNALEEAQALLTRIKELANVNEVYFTQISPVLVVHTGPGTLGVIISEV